MKLKDILLISSASAASFLDSGVQNCDAFNPGSSRGEKQAKQMEKWKKAEKNGELTEKQLEKIIGGQEVEDHTTWKWLVSIAQRCFGYEGEDCDPGDIIDHVDGKGAGHICGATAVLDGSYLLTAAHCIDDDAGRAAKWVFEQFEVLYGSNDLNQASSARIIGTVIHPDFTANRLFNDIALVKLDKSVASADDVACIPPANYNFDVSFPDGDIDAFTAGWGKTLTSSGTVIESREVGVPMVADATCENRYQNILDSGAYDYDELHNLHDDQTVCAGFSNGINGEGESSDACQGDSGGPLVRKVDGIGYSLIGVTSWGYGCATSYGVYTQVGNFADWIQEAKAALDDCQNDDLCLNQSKVDSGKCGGKQGNCSTKLCFVDGTYINRPAGCKNCKKFKAGQCGGDGGGGGGAKMCGDVELPDGCASCKRLRKGKCGGGGGGPTMCGDTELPAGCKNCTKFYKGKCGGGGGGGGGKTCNGTPLPSGCKNCKKFKKGKC